MWLMMVSSILILSISTMMILASMIFSKKSFMDREKSSPFECGFNPLSSARLPFSLQFFIIAVIFLIFDVEITLIMPFILISKITNIMNLTLSFTFLITILIMGLFHEWNQGALSWSS
uniref:NADH-ubiquinone oxidoreductase chain 3 n=1 Tax=Elateroidea sp. BMNH 1274729 TaxID=1796501 RepID=A0A126TGF2_9COLE|nr:NADH dehydrogenase subunit 3 [Elateroidea sp. BMNH 1274729]